ncbi:hypothetical protein, partial [Streptomyces sp. NRRL S-31]|uniref:hypothetical protein n=1 Tax=Streptomyces sp. NRRL S-31 TaxID=1463898 RepID=UPI0005615AE8
MGVYLRALTVWRAAAPAGEDRGTRIPPDGTYITLTDPTPVPLTRTRGADIPVGTWLFQARHVGLTGLTDNEITQLEEAGLRVGEADSTDRRILQNPADPGAA